MNTEAMLALVKKLPGHVGFYAEDTVTGEQAAWQPQLPVEAASVIKIMVMAEAFRQKEAGLLDFEAPVTILPEHKKPSCGALTYLHDGLTVQIRDLVTLMIIVSDNTATNLLIDLLGIDRINEMINSLGLTGTCVRRKLFMPELARTGVKNYVCAGDMARVMKLLMTGRIVSEEASAEMLHILGDQRLNGKMPFFLHSRGIKCAHKTGEDDRLTHDVGVIFAEHPVIFCFVSEFTDVPAAERTLQDLAAMAAGIL